MTTPVPAARRRLRWVLRCVVVAHLAVVAVGVVAGVARLGETPVTSLDVGDCIAHLRDGPVTRLPTAPCVVRHEAEVVGTADAVASDAAAHGLCTRAFARHPALRPGSDLTGRTERSEGGHVLCLVVGDLRGPLQG